MTTHDNAPPPADWTPTVGNTCAGCAGSANLCRVTVALYSERCCSGCSHSAATVPSGDDMPVLWAGDQA